MKIHHSEVRGGRSGTTDFSIEFLQITDKGLEELQVGSEPTDFTFYFTKSGKKTVRALRTVSNEEVFKFFRFYSKDQEFFEVSPEWMEVEVSETGFIKAK